MGTIRKGFWMDANSDTLSVSTSTSNSWADHRCTRDDTNPSKGKNSNKSPLFHRSKISQERNLRAKLVRTNSASLPDCSTAGITMMPSIGQTISQGSIRDKGRSSSDTPGLRLAAQLLSPNRDPCPICVVRSFKTTPKGTIIDSGSFYKSLSSHSLRSSGSLNLSHNNPITVLDDRKGTRNEISNVDSGNGSDVSSDNSRESSRQSSVDRDKSEGDEYELKKESKTLICVKEDIKNSAGFKRNGTKSTEAVPNIHITPSYFKTLVLGAPGVGKTSLVQQFTWAAVTDPSINDDEECNRPGGSHLVSVLLDGQESTMEFIDGTNILTDLEDYQVDAYVLVYSVSQPESFEAAASLLLHLRLDLGLDRPVYLVANKTDLVRQSRVAAPEAYHLAITNDCHFIETSTALNVNVDQLFAGVLCSIQHQLTPHTQNPKTKSTQNKKTSPGGNRQTQHLQLHPGCCKLNSRRRSSFGKSERRCSGTHNSSSNKRKGSGSGGLVMDDPDLANSLLLVPSLITCPPSPAFSCMLTPSRSSLVSRSHRLSDSNISSSHPSKSSNNDTSGSVGALTAIGNFIKHAVSRRESKRRVSHP